MLIGGFTICKSAFIFKVGALTEEDKRIWREVRILVIDEISFMPNGQLDKLHSCLQEIGNRNKPFGGFSIVFSGNFRQLESLMVTERTLLWSKKSSDLWNNTINVVIILDNELQFQIITGGPPPMWVQSKEMGRNDHMHTKPSAGQADAPDWYNN